MHTKFLSILCTFDLIGLLICSHGLCSNAWQFVRANQIHLGGKKIENFGGTQKNIIYQPFCFVAFLFIQLYIFCRSNAEEIFEVAFFFRIKKLKMVVNGKF